jgi:hypothetical protein
VVRDKPIREMSLAERREYLWMLRLRELPQFRQIVWKLSHGESTTAVTEWFMAQPDRGEMAGCSFDAVHRYMRTAAAWVRRQAEAVPRIDVTELHRTAVSSQLNSRIATTIKGVPEPMPWDEVSELVTEAVQNTNGQTALKYCFVIQQARVKSLRDMEAKMKMVLPHGNKAVEVLREIAADIRKYELAEAVLKKGSEAFVSSLVPQESLLMPEVQEIAKMSEVDKNLTREATQRIIDLIQQEGRTGPYANRVIDERGRSETPQS